jgi:hypothetical protein
MNKISRFNSLDEAGGQDQASQRGHPISRLLGSRSRSSCLSVTPITRSRRRPA